MNNTANIAEHASLLEQNRHLAESEARMRLALQWILVIAPPNYGIALIARRALGMEPDQQLTAEEIVQATAFARGCATLLHSKGRQ